MHALFRVFWRRLCTSVSTMEGNSSKNLSEMTVEELRAEVIKLRKHNTDLTNIIKKRDVVDDKKWQSRPYNLDGARKRHILLWVSYLGWSFDGFVTQQHTGKSVEDVLFSALQKVHLVGDIKTANYSRCGRTDNGVSAFSQVISLDVRSIQPFDHSPLTEPELPYCAMLNRVLPKDLRAIAWRPAAEDLNARFHCVSRTYKYFFPKEKLNIEKMQEACTYLEGSHDFRNLCKMDVANGVTKFVRTIDSARIEELEIQRDLLDPAFNMFSLTVQSAGFLYHQIRSIMHVLFLVGEGYEEPQIVKELLDIEKNPRKPQYNLASELPLNLFSVEYPSDGFEWIFEERSTTLNVYDFHRNWTHHACKTAMLRSILQEMQRVNPSMQFMRSSFYLSNATGQPAKYRPLLGRKKCESLEEKVDQLVKKRKIMIVEGEPDQTKVVKIPKIKVNITENEETQDKAAADELERQSAIDELCEIAKKVAEAGSVCAENENVHTRDNSEVQSDEVSKRTSQTM